MLESHWVTVSNKHCPPGTKNNVSVFTKAQRVLLQPRLIQRTRGVAAIMHYKEAEIVLEVMNGC